MSKKIIFSAGGTGGHIFPAINLMKHYFKKGYKVLLVTDKRGDSFLKDNPEFASYILKVDTPTNKNLLKRIFSYFVIFYSVIKSVIILIKEKPNLIFGLGGYVSFPVSFASKFFNLPLIIYENNMILGRANKYLLPFSKKILVAHEVIENFPNKYVKKINHVGAVLDKKIINNININKKNDNEKFEILVIGGSQGAKIFGDIIPEVVKRLKDHGFKIIINQQCNKDQMIQIQDFYKKNNIESNVFEFNKNAIELILSSDIAISRCGASTTSELVHAQTPFIAVPLPKSIDNHQYLNAKYYENKGCCWLLEQDRFSKENLFQIMLAVMKDKNNLKNIRENIASNEIIHFIGIGGIGMSGLAQIMNNMGFTIQGSDLTKNKNTERLITSGIKVYFGHQKKNIRKATMVVYSSAIKKNNEELLASKQKNLPMFKRGEMLANIVALKKNIIITGSHGKTTTTSLVANILVEAGLDPTVINGGVINSLKNTAQLGRGEWAVIESDESDGSFLKLPITYSIVTNVDKEHLDFYKSFENLKKSFINFIEKTPSFGKSIVCTDDDNLKSLLLKTKSKNFLTYGFKKDTNFHITNVRRKKSYSIFDLSALFSQGKNYKLRDIKLNLIGDHNIRNATASICIALNLGIKINIIKKALKKFSGIQRRFTKIFSIEKIDFYDDYAHHPTEIRSVIDGARQVFKNRKIVCVFQPHRYSRVRSLKKEFASSFLYCDRVILCPVYSAGEKAKYNYNQDSFSKLISKKSKTQVINIQNKNDLKNYIRKNLLKNEMVICMGAGSISNWIREIGNELK